MSTMVIFACTQEGALLSHRPKPVSESLKSGDLGLYLFAVRLSVKCPSPLKSCLHSSSVFGFGSGCMCVHVLKVIEVDHFTNAGVVDMCCMSADKSCCPTFKLGSVPASTSARRSCISRSS